VKICIPVNEDKGLDSPVCPHFGSTPLFLSVDTDTGETRAIVNQNQHHGHGMCRPLAALAGLTLDAVVVGGIGMGALGKLQAAGLTVYQAQHPTVAETIAALKAGELERMSPDRACAHHGHGDRH
jgi:predicted Fe-Mo cluster-binding NifX family protein